MGFSSFCALLDSAVIPVLVHVMYKHEVHGILDAACKVLIDLGSSFNQNNIEEFIMLGGVQTLTSSMQRFEYSCSRDAIRIFFNMFASDTGL